MFVYLCFFVSFLCILDYSLLPCLAIAAFCCKRWQYIRYVTVKFNTALYIWQRHGCDITHCVHHRHIYCSECLDSPHSISKWLNFSRLHGIYILAIRYNFLSFRSAIYSALIQLHSFLVNTINVCGPWRTNHQVCKVYYHSGKAYLSYSVIDYCTVFLCDER